VSEELEHAERPPAGEPAGALVLLHGRGADQHDLLPVADALDPERRLHVLTPRGPLSLPPGGAHWYRLAGIPTPDPETFTATRERLAAFLDGVPERTGVPWERTVLGGFSQGTVMSYALGLGDGRPSPAAILAMSGFLPEVPGFALDLAGRRGLPVAISHGTLDQVIPARFGREAATRLEAAGLAVEFRETPVGHGVDPRLIPELREWLAARTVG
jgi:phospholipase/carboxylesterase